jgi:hypothetical protein
MLRVVSYSWILLLVGGLVGGCARVNEGPAGSVPEAASRAGVFSPVPSPRPTIAGNGEPYNGPHLSGVSVPGKRDPHLTSENLSLTVGRCMSHLNLAVTAQIYGEQTRPEFFTTFAQAEVSGARARSFIMVPTNEGPVMRVQTRATLAVRDGIVSPDEPLSVWVTPIEVPADSEPSATPDNLWLETTDALPFLKYRIPERASLNQEAGGALEYPIETLRLFRPIAMSPMSLLHEHGLRRVSSVGINLDELALCLEIESQTADEEVLTSPAGGSRPLFADSHKTRKFERTFLSEAEAIVPPSLSGDSVTARRNYQWKRWAAYRQAAHRIFQSYFEKGWSAATEEEWMHWCVSKSNSALLSDRNDCERMSYLVSDFFYRGGIERIRQAGRQIQSLEYLVSSLAVQHPQNRFRLGLAKSRAGYHRGAEYIAMNLSETPPQEFDIDFVHELLHQSDEQLRFAVSEFEAVADQIESGRAKTPMKSLIHTLVSSGLDRGFRAEWRDWTVTLAIYRAAVASQIWPRIDRLEAMFPGRDSQTSEALDLKKVAFDALNAEFIDPNVGFFADDRFSLALLQQRTDMINQSAKLELGSLTEIYHRALADFERASSH